MAIFGNKPGAKIIVDPANTVYDSRDNCNAIIETATNSLIVGSNTTVIPNTVKIICNNAFSGCQFESISIPNSITQINSHAFASCDKLKTINIPESVKIIGTYAFSGCSNLENVVLNSGLEAVDMRAFLDCDKLKEITFPMSVVYIGDFAFGSYQDRISHQDIYKTTCVVKGYNNSEAKNYAQKADMTFISLGDASEKDKTNIANGFTGQNSLYIFSDSSYTGSPIKRPTQFMLQYQKYDDNGTIQYFKTLTENIDYTVEYKDNINVGIATATIKGKGMFTGSLTNHFRILFRDVLKTTGYPDSYIYWAVDNGIVKGFSDGTYKPKNNCTRSDMMIMLWRLAGKPSASGTLKFTDCKNLTPSSDRYKAILWGYTNGIVKGYSNGTFGKDSPIVRKDTMIMLYRMAGKPAVSGKTGFPDVDGKYAINTDTYKAIRWGVQKGITSGYKASDGPKLAGKFGTHEDCLREHIATFVQRYATKVK